jgi:hypothetical protein
MALGRRERGPLYGQAAATEVEWSVMAWLRAPLQMATCRNGAATPQFPASLETGSDLNCVTAEPIGRHS